MNLPSIRQRAWLVIPSHPDTRIPVQVEDREEPFVVVTAPVDRGGRPSLEPGAQVRLQFIDSDGHVTLETQVAGIVGGGKALRLEVLDATRGQRRQYLRWEVDLPVRLRYRDDEGGEGEDGGFWRARLVNLGGGGIGIRSGKQLDESRPVLVQFRLSNGAVAAEGSIVMQKPEGAAWKVGIKFTRIAEEARSRIVRFIFQEELRWRRALLGDTEPLS